MSVFALVFYPEKRMREPTFVNGDSDMVWNVIFSNINNIITRIQRSIRPWVIVRFVIKEIEASGRSI